ncbi:MAG TPA: hypothetical protein VK527_03325 [Candidatus Limnocylindrales bacterium]|nr:hypothetical protein [Candidatus Limnocylindrales bacterium]
MIRKLSLATVAFPHSRPLDVEGYVRLTEFFRGHTPADSLIAPFCFRPLVPFAASVLPVDAPSAVNVINLLCLMLTVLALDRILSFLGYAVRARTLGCLLFIVSFPTFYYGTIGFVDPAAVMFVTLGIYAVLKGRWVLLGAITVLGVLAKETVGIVALLPILRTRRQIALAALLSGLAVLTLAWVRALLPGHHFLWLPSLRTILDNAARPRTYLTFLLTVGPLLALALAGAWKRRLTPGSHFFWAGFALALAVYVYSLFSTYADGRSVWTAVPFLVPLAVSLFARADANPGLATSAHR